MAKDKDRNKRGVRDQAGVGPEPGETRHLTPMKELKKFRVASGEPDVRGWSVYTSNGREIGKVEDLLVDTSRSEVVMLDIDLRDSDRHTLAPIRAAWVDRDSERVVLDGAQFDAEEEIPSLRRGQHLSDEDTRAFRDRYVRAYGERGFGDEDYRIDREGNAVRFRRRRGDRPADEAPHDYEIERVDPEERSARAPMDEHDEWRDVRYPSREHEEQVIERRPVVVEETVVRRRVLGDDEARESQAERGPGPDDIREERR